MTAFAKAKNSFSGLTVHVEIQSVNKKFLEVQCKCPPEWGFFEHEIRKKIGSFVERGQLTVFLQVLYSDPQAVEVHVNEAYVSGLVSALDKIGKTFDCRPSADALFRAIVREKGVFQSLFRAQDAPDVQQKVLETLELALKGLVEMQKKEGALIAEEFTKRLETIKACRQKIQTYAEDAPARFRAKIESLIQEFTAGNPELQERVAKEVAFASDKVDVSEELARLGYHIEHFTELLTQKKNQGKVLEFILQECVREVNTIGSKCQDARISKCVIEAKSEIEKMKEQVQNVQ